MDVKGDGLCIGLTAHSKGPHIHGDQSLHRVLSDAIDSSLLYSYCLHGFYWSSVQINRDSVSVPPKDKSNVGPSAIALSGDFEGGELVVDCELPLSDGVAVKDGKSTYSVRNEWLIFDGHDEHYSLAYSGKVRYSLVAFFHKSVGQLDPIQFQHLFNRNYILPLAYVHAAGSFNHVRNMKLPSQ